MDKIVARALPVCKKVKRGAGESRTLRLLPCIPEGLILSAIRRDRRCGSRAPMLSNARGPIMEPHYFDVLIRFFLMQLIIRRFFPILLGVAILLALMQSAEGRGFLS